MRGSHAIAKSMSRGQDVASGTGVAAAMEFVLTHVMAMETGSPVSHVRV